MATSGTIGMTVIDTVKVLDHAVRRCGLSPSTLTPEQIDTALENLYLILTSIVNRGVNLWCVEEQILGLQVNQSAYQLPVGTIDVLSANYRTGAQLAYTKAQTNSTYTATFDVATPVKTLGMVFSDTRVLNLVLEASNDGTSWSAVKTLPQFTAFAGTWYWWDIDPSFATPYFRIRETVADTTTVAVAFVSVILMQDVYERPLSPMSRDTYTSLSNKNMAGTPVQYMFDKQINPVLNLWLVPNDVYGHVVIIRQRYIQDVGSLQDKLEIPERWFDAIIWGLARHCAFELPSVDEKRMELCVAMAQKSLEEAEDGETDGSPIYIQPNISPYTK